MNYHLVLERRPGDFVSIDINILTDIKDYYNSLYSIDSFTKNYTYSELIDLIISKNLVSKEYLEGKLEIINDNKYRYDLLTKEDTFAFDVFFIKYINDKIMMNKFINIYRKYSNIEIDNMTNYINSKDIKNILSLIMKQNYEVIRNIYIYLSKNVK